MMGMEWGCDANMILLILIVITFISGGLVIIANDHHCFLYSNANRHVQFRCSSWLLKSMWSGGHIINVDTL